MSGLFQKYVAALVLVALCACYAHVLADALAFGCHCTNRQVAMVTSYDGTGNSEGHHGSHGMSCDRLLCSGSSGVMIETEMLLPMDTAILSEPFGNAADEGFPSRTVEPLLAPPKRA
jgi:hypothetical protein